MLIVFKAVSFLPVSELVSLATFEALSRMTVNFCYCSLLNMFLIPLPVGDLASIEPLSADYFCGWLFGKRLLHRPKKWLNREEFFEFYTKLF